MTDEWVERAAQAYESSTEYLDANYRSQWEEALSHFRGEHAPDSKYHKEQYKYRSKVFRPKTRASIRANEAACVTAFFSNDDVVSCEPGNSSDPAQIASAAIMQEVLNYRLTKSIPWFQILVGGFQDAQTVGVVCSRQDWEYVEKPVDFEVPSMDMFGQPMVDETGEFQVEKVTEYEIIKDQPAITLIPVENLRIHPGADWKDPVNSSPFIIELMAMTVADVTARMKSTDSKTGEPKWNKIDEKAMKECVVEDDSTRQRREEREDKYTANTTSDVLSAYDMVRVHRNIMRIDGEDVVFYTLGTKHLLSKPVPVETVYPQGRPYVMGCCIMETHKIYPTGIAGLGTSIQKEMNQIANQRLDNVQLVLNKRYYVKRGSQVDTQSLLRNVPGSVTFVNDVNDIQEAEFSDVTGSSYQEQDRLNMDYDEVTGTFSTGSINSNRKLGETVGGMTMLRGTSNLQTEYLLRTFAETWVEPVLRQVVKLEQKLESDQVVLNFAAEQAQAFQKYGVDQVTDQLLDQELSVTVNVGMGATDPVTRLERFVMATGQYNQLAIANMQLGPSGLNLDEVRKEIFGRLGYKDGQRFFQSDEVAGLTQQMQEMQQQYEQQIQQMQTALQDKNQKEQADIQIRMMAEQNRAQQGQANIQLQAMAEQNKTQQGQVNAQLTGLSEQNKAQMAQERNQTDLQRQQMANQNALQQKLMDLANPVSGERIGR